MSELMPVLEWSKLQAKIRECGLECWGSERDEGNDRYLIFALLKTGEKFLIGYAKEVADPILGISHSTGRRARTTAQWKREQNRSRTASRGGESKS